MDLSELLSSEREDVDDGRAAVPPAPPPVRSSSPLLQPPPRHTDRPAASVRFAPPPPHLLPSHVLAGGSAPPLPSAPLLEDPTSALAPPSMAVMPLRNGMATTSGSLALPSLLQLGLGRGALFPSSPPSSNLRAPGPSPVAASSCVSPYGAVDLPASTPVPYMASPLGATPPIPSSIQSSPLRPLTVGGVQAGLGTAASCGEKLSLARQPPPPPATATAPAGMEGRSPPPPSPLTPLLAVPQGTGRRGGALPGFAELSSSLGLGPSALPSMASADGRPDASRTDWGGGASGHSQAGGARRLTGLAPLPLPSGGIAYADRPSRPFASPSSGWGPGVGTGLVASATEGHLSSSWSDGRPREALATSLGGRSTKSSPDRSWGVEKRRGSGSGRLVDRARAFACHLCGYRFGQKGSLHRHIAAVHECRRPHECGACGKSFAERWTLRVHERNVHEKLKPHTCPVCFKSFGEVWNRDKHVANLHHGHTPTRGVGDPRDAVGRDEPHSAPVGDGSLYGRVHRGGDYGGAGGGVPYGGPAFPEPLDRRGRTDWM